MGNCDCSRRHTPTDFRTFGGGTATAVEETPATSTPKPEAIPPQVSGSGAPAVTPGSVGGGGAPRRTDTPKPSVSPPDASPTRSPGTTTPSPGADGVPDGAGGAGGGGAGGRPGEIRDKAKAPEATPAADAALSGKGGAAPCVCLRVCLPLWWWRWFWGWGIFWNHLALPRAGAFAPRGPEASRPFGLAPNAAEPPVAGTESLAATATSAGTGSSIRPVRWTLTFPTPTTAEIPDTGLLGEVLEVGRRPARWIDSEQPVGIWKPPRKPSSPFGDDDEEWEWGRRRPPPGDPVVASIGSSASARGSAFLDGGTGRIGSLNELERERAVSPGDTHHGWDVSHDERLNLEKAPPHSGVFKYGGIDFGPSGGLWAPDAPALDDGHGYGAYRRDVAVEKPDCGCGCHGCSTRAPAGAIDALLLPGADAALSPSAFAGSAFAVGPRMPFGTAVPSSSAELVTPPVSVLQDSYEFSGDSDPDIADGQVVPRGTGLHPGQHSGRVPPTSGGSIEKVPTGVDKEGFGGGGGLLSSGAAASASRPSLMEETRRAREKLAGPMEAWAAAVRAEEAARARYHLTPEGKPEDEEGKKRFRDAKAAYESALADLKAAEAAKQLPYAQYLDALTAEEFAAQAEIRAMLSAGAQYSDKKDFLRQWEEEKQRQERWAREAAARRERKEWKVAAGSGSLALARSVQTLRSMSTGLRDAATHASARLTQIRDDLKPSTSKERRERERAGKPDTAKELKKKEREVRALAKEAEREAKRAADAARAAAGGGHARAADQQEKRAAAAQKAADAAQSKAEKAQQAAEAAQKSGDKRKAEAARRKAEQAKRKADAAKARAEKEKKKAEEKRKQADDAKSPRLKAAEERARKKADEADRKRRELEALLAQAEKEAAAKAEARRERKRAERKRRGRKVYSGVFPDCDPDGCRCRPGDCKPYQLCMCTWVAGAASQKGKGAGYGGPPAGVGVSPSGLPIMGDLRGGMVLPQGLLSGPPPRQPSKFTGGGGGSAQEMDFAAPSVRPPDAAGTDGMPSGARPRPWDENVSVPNDGAHVGPMARREAAVAPFASPSGPLPMRRSPEGSDANLAQPAPGPAAAPDAAASVGMAPQDPLSQTERALLKEYGHYVAAEREVDAAKARGEDVADKMKGLEMRRLAWEAHRDAYFAQFAAAGAPGGVAGVLQKVVDLAGGFAGAVWKMVQWAGWLVESLGVTFEATIGIIINFIVKVFSDILASYFGVDSADAFSQGLMTQMIEEAEWSAEAWRGETGDDRARADERVLDSLIAFVSAWVQNLLYEGAKQFGVDLLPQIEADLGISIRAFTSTRDPHEQDGLSEEERKRRKWLKLWALLVVLATLLRALYGLFRKLGKGVRKVREFFKKKKSQTTTPEPKVEAPSADGGATGGDKPTGRGSTDADHVVDGTDPARRGVGSRSEPRTPGSGPDDAAKPAPSSGGTSSGEETVRPADSTPTVTGSAARSQALDKAQQSLGKLAASVPDPEVAAKIKDVTSITRAFGLSPRPGIVPTPSMELVTEVTRCKVDLHALADAVHDVVDYYKAVLARDPTNPAAPERLQFFMDLLDLLRRECR